MGYAQTNFVGNYLTLGSYPYDTYVSTAPMASIPVGDFNLPVNLAGKVNRCYIDWNFRTVEDTSGGVNEITNQCNVVLYQGATGHNIIRFLDTGTFHVLADEWRAGAYIYGSIDVHSYLNFGSDQYVFLEYPEALGDFLKFTQSQVVLRMWIA
jgi:hypothetical protein